MYREHPVIYSAMTKEFNNKLKGTFLVPVGLSLVLVPFSLLIGWNLFTMLLFWMVVTPALTIYLPPMITKDKDHLWESLVGMAIFYAVMVFLIYDHYKTDYFKLMIGSLVVNMIVVAGISWAKRRRPVTQPT